MLPENLNKIYMIGIGGIGMSALARYFHSQGKEVSGYDLTRSHVCKKLETEGIDIHYNEDQMLIPKDADLVIYTPAVPPDHKELAYYKQHQYPVFKRSKVLGFLTEDHTTIAVAGTHGKTSISSMIAHIFTTSDKKCHAFIGGIMKNYRSNYVEGGSSEFMVVEADEFDRSFLRLNPDFAVISAVDADHLDIYGDFNTMLGSFQEFAERVKKGGTLIVNSGVGIPGPKTNMYSYSLYPNAHFHAVNIRIEDEKHIFDIKYPGGTITDISMQLPGRFNIENAVASCAIALKAGITPGDIKEGLETFSGIHRRFEYQIRRSDFIYIDDYAHHPEEIRAVVNAVREMHPGRKITGVFQPHLYSRTRDFANEFAESLELLDKIILIDIYPAREKPIKGVSSKIIYDKISKTEKLLISKNEVIIELEKNKPELLLTLGAGNIDELVTPVITKFSQP